MPCPWLSVVVAIKLTGRRIGFKWAGSPRAKRRKIPEPPGSEKRPHLFLPPPFGPYRAPPPPATAHVSVDVENVRANSSDLEGGGSRNRRSRRCPCWISNGGRRMLRTFSMAHHFARVLHRDPTGFL